MTINQEKITKVYELYHQLDEIKELASELLRTAQDRYNDNEVEIKRNDCMIKIKERVLWEETFQLGKNSQAALKLKELHPEVFEAYSKQEELAEEIKKFMIAEFGIDYQAIRISDILRLIEAVVDFKRASITSD